MGRTVEPPVNYLPCSGASVSHILCGSRYPSDRFANVTDPLIKAVMTESRFAGGHVLAVQVSLLCSRIYHLQCAQALRLPVDIYIGQDV